MCIQTSSLGSRTMESDNLRTAALELEELRRWEETKDAQYNSCTGHRRFPPACLSLLKNISGNFFCVDCEASNPQWATVTYGALLCLQCSGKHRQLGVQVRNVHMSDEFQIEASWVLGVRFNWSDSIRIIHVSHVYVTIICNVDILFTHLLQLYLTLIIHYLPHLMLPYVTDATYKSFVPCSMLRSVDVSG